MDQTKSDGSVMDQSFLLLFQFFYLAVQILGGTGEKLQFGISVKSCLASAELKRFLAKGIQIWASI